MEEIKVNDFVRLKNGRIVKVKDADKEKIYFDSDIYFLNGIPVFEIENIFSDFIVKHSENIIDLIEVGDYVNGEKALNVDWGGIRVKDYEYIQPEEIETVLTKEMMKSISYKVERKS